MRSYSQIKVFDQRAFDLFQAAEKCVAAIPDPKDVESLRCHEVARAVGRVLDLDVQDGRYGCVEHSWLWLERYPPTPPTCLLDVYCVGRLPMVQLVDINCVLPHWRPLQKRSICSGYYPGEARTDIREAVVRKLARAMLQVDRRVGVAP